jgi:uncharacterized protein
MSRVRALYDLQQIDSRIDGTNTSLTAIEEALKDTSTVDNARVAVGEAETALVTARNELKELEAKALKQKQHADDLEKKLYGGAIKGQKEMSAAQSEIETFRKLKNETDNTTVEAMVVVEDAEATFKTAKQSLADAQADYEKSTAALRQERDRLTSEMTPIQADRAKKLKMVMPPDVPVYEKLRQQKAGVAVVELLLGKTCAGCRVEIPMAKQRDVRGGTAIVNCPRCGRILYYKLG